MPDTSPTPLSPSPAFVAELRKWLTDEAKRLYREADHAKSRTLASNLESRGIQCGDVLAKLDELEGAEK